MQHNNRGKADIEDQLAELLECRWVALYPSFLDALYSLQEFAFGAPIESQILAVGDERSAQYALFKSILGGHAPGRIVHVDPTVQQPLLAKDEDKPEVVWWEGVPFPQIESEGVEGCARGLSATATRLTDVTLAPLSAHMIDTDYCLMSDMRGIVGRTDISCAALIGATKRADRPPVGDRVSFTSLNELRNAIPTARQRATIRAQNADEVMVRLETTAAFTSVERPNLSRAAWFISMRRWGLRASRSGSDLFSSMLGLETSSLTVIDGDISRSGSASLILSVGLEDPEVVLHKLDMLFPKSTV